MSLDEEIEKAAIRVLTGNRKQVGWNEFTQPSRHEYRHQWLWDSSFHAIGIRHFDPEFAEAELLSLADSQLSNGMVPHESKISILGFPTGYTSAVTQPPFIARATLDVYLVTRKKAFLGQMFPNLERYHKWLEREREHRGILTVANPLESGEDNSIVWDSTLPADLRKAYSFAAAHLPLPNPFRLQSVTSTAIYADALECMTVIAETLGDSEAADQYSQKHTEVVAAMRREFTQPDGLFYHKDAKGRPILRKTHAIFAPLFAGAVTQQEAGKLVAEHLFNDREFWTRYPIPTVAVSEPKFSPTNYWRGPTWVNVNWMLHRGLLRYGFKDVAEELRKRTLEMVGVDGFREYYHTITGQGFGARDYSWTAALAVDMMRK